MPRILITGVTGFVGSNLVTYFKDLGDYSIIGYSRDTEKARAKFRKYPLEVITDYSSTVLNELKIDYVIHLAGIAHDLSNQYKAEDYFNANYEGTKRAFDEFRQSNASKFIFVSSIKTIADISSEPITEEAAPKPLTDYGKSKLKAEQYI